MLIGHWPLMGDTDDFSKNSLNATGYNLTYTDNGRIGKAATFNGTSSYVALPSAVVNPESDFAMRFLVYPTSANNYSLYTSRTVVGEGLSVFVLSGEIRFDLGGQWSTGITVTLNKWTDVVVVRRGTTKYVYLNGALSGSTSIGTVTNFNSSLATIGASQISGSSFGNYFTGNLNDVRIYNRALSDKEIYDLSKCLVHWYKLNGDPLDSGAYGMNGTNGSSTAYSTTTKTHSQSWLNSDAGSNKEVTATNNLKNHITGDQTIAMWLYPTSFAARRNPYNKAYGGEGTITQETSGQVNYYYGTHGGDASPYQGFTLTTPLTLNAWNHIAIVRNNTAVSPTLKWYLNGSEANSVVADYALSAITTANIRIGGGYVSNYQGHISDLRVYGTALSASDISDLYSKRAFFDNAGNVKVYELNEYQEPIVSSGLILNLDANDRNSISAIGCTGFNNAPQLVRSTVNTSTYTITTDSNIRIGNLSYFTAFAIDYPESSYGGDAANRHGITPGFNVRSGTKLYSATRALHLFVFNNSTNSWLPTSYFNGWALSGQAYDVYSGSAIKDSELTKFINDYNAIRSAFKNCTYVIIGSHRADYYPQSLLDLLIDAGAPSNASSLLVGQQPEWILIGEPGLGAGNAYSWALHNYSTNPSQVAHTNFGLPLYGRRGNYFDIAGSGNFISVADTSLLDIAGDKTLACWVYMGADTSGAGIVAKANTTVYGMALGYGWGGNGFMGLAWNSANAPAIVKDLARDVQKWCYLTVTQSGSTRTIYVYDEQGLRTATSTSGTHTWNNSLPLYVGADSDGTNRIPNGSRIGMVSVYDRAISADEVLTNFNNTKINFYNDGNKNTINSSGRAFFSEFVENELLASGVRQAITNNGSLVIDGEFSEVE